MAQKEKTQLVEVDISSADFLKPIMEQIAIRTEEYLTGTLAEKGIKLEEAAGRLYKIDYSNAEPPKRRDGYYEYYLDYGKPTELYLFSQVCKVCFPSISLLGFKPPEIKFAMSTNPEELNEYYK